MCDKCGHDHPEFDDIKRDLFYLDQLWQGLIDAEQKRKEDPDADDRRKTVLPYGVEWFSHSIIENTVDEFAAIGERVGRRPYDIVCDYAHSMFLAGFAIGAATGDRYKVDEYPPEPVSFPTAEEADAWKERQEKMLEEREQSSTDALLKALKEAGIEIPEHAKVKFVTDANLNELGKAALKEGEQKKTGDDEGPSTGMYL